MIPEPKHQELPKITYEETGWRQTLAIYRIAVWHEHENEKETAHLSYRDALAKLGCPKPENLRARIGVVKIINDFMEMKQIYTQCEMIEPFANGEVSMMRIVRVLAEHGIKDIRRFNGNFECIAGIGPKYAGILEEARKHAWAEEVKAGNQTVGMCIKVPKCLKDRYVEMAAEDMVSVNELAKKVLMQYAAGRPRKK